MLIKIITGQNSDGYEWQEMTIDGKGSISVHPLCESPEDAIIGRSLISCDEIADLMRQAHEDGKAGKPFSVESIEED